MIHSLKQPDPFSINQVFFINFLQILVLSLQKLNVQSQEYEQESLKKILFKLEVNIKSK